TKLESLLQGSEVHLQVRSAVAEDATAEDAPPETFRIRPASRPLDDLPLVYWFQCFAGIAGFLIGLWVLALSPRSGGARLFAAMGCMFLVFTITAAPYSTRELAIHGTTFRVLSALNHS